MRLDLVRMDLCFLDEMLPRNSPQALQKPMKSVGRPLRMKVGVELLRQPISLAPPEESGCTRKGRVEIPSAAGPFGLRDQRMLWGLEVRLGWWSRWAAVYPVAIREPGPAEGVRGGFPGEDVRELELTYQAYPWGISSWTTVTRLRSSRPFRTGITDSWASCLR